MERGRIVPVPIVRVRPDKRRFRLRQPQRYSQRPAKGRKTRSPGELVQIDTLFVNLTPGEAIKHFTAYDTVAKWTLGHVSTEASANAAKALLAKLIAAAPFPVKGVQVDGGSEFMSVFEDHCRDKGLEPVVLPPNGPTSTAPSSAPSPAGATSSTPPTTCQIASTSCSPSSTPSLTVSSSTGLTRPLATKPRPSISKPLAHRPARLISRELGHGLDEQNAGGKSRLRRERPNVFRIRPSRWSSLAPRTWTSPGIPRLAKSAG